MADFATQYNHESDLYPERLHGASIKHVNSFGSAEVLVAEGVSVVEKLEPFPNSEVKL